jgi:colanic acid/amylovoran biosynthesis protein
MKIAISHIYSSNNKGDAAILAAQIRELERVFPQAAFIGFTIDTIAEAATFEGMPLTNSLMYYALTASRSRVVKAIYGLVMMGYTTLWALAYKRTRLQLPIPKRWARPIHRLLDADMQVGVGGGYLRGTPDLLSSYLLLLLTHQLVLAKLLQKPVYLYAQSIGPFYGRFQRQVAKTALNHVDVIILREEVSRRYIDGMALTKPRIITSADTAFLFETSTSFNVAALFQSTKPRQIAGITAREWLEPKTQQLYEEGLVELIRYLTTHNYGVVAIPQVTSRHHGDDDREVIQRLASAVGSNELFIPLHAEYDHHTIKALYASLDLLIGTRFHSVIFALSSDVPCIAIEYEHKTSGIMIDLGLEEWYIAMEDVDGEKLIALFEKLRSREVAYRQHLAATIPAYKHSAHRGASMIAEHQSSVTT